MNHEDNVLDDIDALMAQGLDDHGVPLDDYQSNRYDKCPLGEHDWHGTPNNYGCPGAWASESEVAAYQSGSKSVETKGLTAAARSISELYESVFGDIINRVSSVVDLFQVDHPEPGTVLATLPAQIFGIHGEPIDGTITVVAQSDGYAAAFDPLPTPIYMPTESPDSVAMPEYVASQLLRNLPIVAEEREND